MMEGEFHRWFHDLQVTRTISALQRNNFDAHWAPDVKTVLEAIFKIIPDGALVGTGGSITLNQIGFFEKAGQHNIKLINPSLQKLSMEDFTEQRRQILLADVFLSSANAITEDGVIFNVDGTGNRVASMTFGPKKVIVVCGINKIVKDIGAAQKKVREYTAPMNAKRIGLKTPCAKTGVCADCDSPQRICNVFVTMAKKPTRTDMTVFLVGEHLGF
jgi:LUD domain